MCILVLTSIESAPSPLRTSQNSIPTNATNNINTHTGHQEPPTPTRAYVPAKADLKNAALLLRLLEKKEKLLQEITEMNNQAEKVEIHSLRSNEVDE